MLGHLLPNESEMEAIHQIVSIISQNSHLKNVLKLEFKEFLEQNNLPQIDRYRISRFFDKDNRLFSLDKPRGLSSSEFIYFYDYLCTAFYIKRSNMPDDANERICALIRDVLNKNDDNRIMHVPFFSLMKTALLARRDTRGLKDFSGTYLGYRLSSSKGELIRYYITIDAKSNNNVSFVNSYHRNEIKWTCRGNGIIHDSNLYLIGQAVDESNEFKHRGYRLFCLHKFMNTNYLYGIVTSHDTIGAIAAKTLIIPISEHDFDASATGDYGRLLREEKSRQGIENNNTQAAAQAIVDADVRFNARHSLSPESFIDLINIQIDASIRSAKNKSENDFTLLELIHNITGTTLKGYRKDRLIDRLHENKDYNESYENIIGRLVEIAATDKLNIEDLFEKMAADYIDARALRSASAPPG